MNNLPVLCLLPPAGPAKTAPSQVANTAHCLLKLQVLMVMLLNHCNAIRHQLVFVIKENTHEAVVG